jgi:hypothetical protein
MCCSGAVVEYWAVDPKDGGSPPACALYDSITGSHGIGGGGPTPPSAPCPKTASLALSKHNKIMNLLFDKKDARYPGLGHGQEKASILLSIRGSAHC